MKIPSVCAPIVAVVVGVGLWFVVTDVVRGQGPLLPTNSSPVAITSDDQFVWVVNPKNNSVTVHRVGGDLNVKLAEIPVGAEPRCVAITPNNAKAYVTNMIAGTVSVINTTTLSQTRIIRVGAEPWGCAITPDGAKLYVANFSSDTVSVINTTTDTVLTTISLTNPKPRAIAIETDGTVYVTHFLAQLRPNGLPVDQNEGRDDGKEGRIT